MECWAADNGYPFWLGYWGDLMFSLFLVLFAIWLTPHLPSISEAVEMTDEEWIIFETRQIQRETQKRLLKKKLLQKRKYG
jgi:hypothetical protein